MIKKTLWVLIVLVFVYLVVNSFTLNKVDVDPSKNKFEEKILDTKITCESKCNEDVSCFDACYSVEINKAVISGDAEKCNVLPSLIKQRCVDKVGLKKALKENNKILCDNLITKDIKELCLRILK